MSKNTIMSLMKISIEAGKTYVKPNPFYMKIIFLYKTDEMP